MRKPLYLLIAVVVICSCAGANTGSSQHAQNFDWNQPFKPFRIIGNIYYVGTRTLTSFLIATPQGAILVNTTYERNVPVIQKSVEQLGFKFSDIKIVLGTQYPLLPIL